MTNSTHQTKLREIELDLEKSYKEFFKFSIDLLKKIDENNLYNLKFAVVNMQIALELFLKFYFLKKGKEDWIFSNIKKFEFAPFSTFLDKFFSEDNDLLITKKKNLKNILEARNKIVHTGKNEWTIDLATNLINTTLFIQTVLNKEFSGTLFENSSESNNELSQNNVWRRGAENFAENIAKLNDVKVFDCWFCHSHSFIDKRIFNYDELDEKGFQCITCLNALYEDYQIGIAKCMCGEKTFVLDCLNPQKDKEYIGECLNCKTYAKAYKCDDCKEYFLDFDNERIISGNEIYCGKKCTKKLQINN